ncbi:KIF6_9 [Mytilus coruscus]|uniref:KIF6_9 n=1 Tax=Mytilus coruscus TaxID=42192 RepID=A0A6J8DSA7_MYTCO|nr:KIF6_9 [Mytilus coruscus]
MQLAMRGLVDPEDAEPDEEEQEMRNEMEEEKKMNYKECFTRLRTLKTEIEHLQHLLEKSKVKLMKDFEMVRKNKLIYNKTITAIDNKRNRNQPGEHQHQTSQFQMVSSHHNSMQQTEGNSQFKMESSQHSNSRSPYESNSRKQYDTVDTDNRKQYDTGQRRPPGLPKSRSDSGNLPMTGDAKADADIMAFIKARQNLLRQAQDKS